MAIVFNTRRTASVRAQTNCEVCVLTNRQFYKVAKQYPEEALIMKDIILSKYGMDDAKKTDSKKKLQEELDRKKIDEASGKRNDELTAEEKLEKEKKEGDQLNEQNEDEDEDEGEGEDEDENENEDADEELVEKLNIVKEREGEMGKNNNNNNNNNNNESLTAKDEEKSTELTELQQKSLFDLRGAKKHSLTNLVGGQFKREDSMMSDISHSTASTGIGSRQNSALSGFDIKPGIGSRQSSVIDAHGSPSPTSSRLIKPTGKEMAGTKKVLSGKDDDVMLLAAAGNEDLWRIARNFKEELRKIDELAFGVIVEEEKLGRRMATVKRKLAED